MVKNKTVLTKKNVVDGMTERELIDLCGDKQDKVYFRGAPYWTAEIYGFGKYIRRYGYYPSFLPLAIYNNHGIEFIDAKPYKHELASDAPVMFYQSQDFVNIWKKFSKKPCYVIYSPFIFYRKKNNIQISDNASGTISFYSHSTDAVDNILDPELYIKQLLNLPKEFQPVSVCLHPTDVKKGIYKYFFKYNIPVYTAGGGGRLFTERFYNILKNFSFATSNSVGSYLFYAVEMGIPFSIYGDRPKDFNINDENIELGEHDPYEESPGYRHIYDLFNGLNTKITAEQKITVENNLGIYDGVSRCKMAMILYSALFKWFFSFRFWKWAYNMLLKIIKKLNKKYNCIHE